jgi:hypothetical protein
MGSEPVPRDQMLKAGNWVVLLQGSCVGDLHCLSLGACMRVTQKSPR